MNYSKFKRVNSIKFSKHTLYIVFISKSFSLSKKHFYDSAESSLKNWSELIPRRFAMPLR